MAIIATDTESGQEISQVITEDERHYLYRMLYESTYDCRQIEWLIIQIKYCEDIDEFSKLRKSILMNRSGPIEKLTTGIYKYEYFKALIREFKNQSHKIELRKI
jgi:hypothetical protein